MSGKQECGNCIYYSNAVCNHMYSKDTCNDRESYYTCNINSFKAKESVNEK